MNRRNYLDNYFGKLMRLRKMNTKFIGRSGVILPPTFLLVSIWLLHGWGADNAFLWYYGLSGAVIYMAILLLLAVFRKRTAAIIVAIFMLAGCTGITFLAGNIRHTINHLSIVCPYGFHGTVNLDFGCPGTENRPIDEGVVVVLIDDSGHADLAEAYPDQAMFTVWEQSPFAGDESLNMINERMTEIKEIEAEGGCRTRISFQIGKQL